MPVKNYINQPQEFALALPALDGTASPATAATGFIALILLFVVNMLYVASARTALIFMPVLLILFAWLHLSRRATRILFACVAAASALIWTISPYLRQRIADVTIEHRAHDLSGIAPTAQWPTYWQARS
ncbi:MULTISPECIES: hypothetical protein [unclassified Bradyrhizobium]|uniref:hypothetical protein n=1 Tax=unclassified Bradyrhizobium TaxID=2631580 RepID=UPI00247B1CB9|nr:MULTISPECIES: hypothetical protein [unclassified Bradyrhizobium]WGS17556.1 hypothetical protein MTX22_23245 [Bradyrhizobium sp. ISRA463]WGS24340.1 hypothetical protein MTX19_20915 [Bradyrhizobium sp. ISRA464]